MRVSQTTRVGVALVFRCLGFEAGALGWGGHNRRHRRRSAPMFANERLRSNPAGIPAISRWLSGSDTTGSDTTGFNGIKTSHPEGVTECGPEKRAVPSGIPCRDAWILSGDVPGMSRRSIPG